MGVDQTRRTSSLLKMRPWAWWEGIAQKSRRCPRRSQVEAGDRVLLVPSKTSKQTKNRASPPLLHFRAPLEAAELAGFSELLRKRSGPFGGARVPKGKSLAVKGSQPPWPSLQLYRSSLPSPPRLSPLNLSFRLSHKARQGLNCCPQPHQVTLLSLPLHPIPHPSPQSVCAGNRESGAPAYLNRARDAPR